MRPDDPRSQRPLVPQRKLLIPDEPELAHRSTPSPRPTAAANEAAANIARTQLENIYTGQTTGASTPATSVQTTSSAPVTLSNDSPYQRTHGQDTDVQADQWREYHSAWQTYYQKYYERYYVGQVYHAKQQLASQLQQSPAPTSVEEGAEKIFSKEEAMSTLKSEIVGKVRSSAKKVRGMKFFVPVIAGIAVMVLVLFLQYNQVLFAYAAAYTQPASANQQPFIPSNDVNVDVGPDPVLIIPKFNINAPIDFDVSTEYNAQMAAMDNGVAYFGIPGANSKPGQLGNVPIAGHSSNDFFGAGNYKFLFAPLAQGRMTTGDAIYVNYNSHRYTYSVTRTEIVEPNEASKLIIGTDKPYLTLISCTPLGTAQKRILVFAEQISPDPSTATAAPGDSSSSSSAVIPGTEPTALQRLFGAN